MSINGATEMYRGFVLDPFQQEALSYIDQNYSVLVAAPTGVGKTLIADYLIEKIHKENGRVVYTAPIKALSNQKFKEFKAIMGEDAVDFNWRCGVKSRGTCPDHDYRDLSQPPAGVSRTGQ